MLYKYPCSWCVLLRVFKYPDNAGYYRVQQGGESFVWMARVGPPEEVTLKLTLD